MLDATGFRIQPIHAPPSTKIDAAPLVFSYAGDLIACQALRARQYPEARMLSSLVHQLGPPRPRMSPPTVASFVIDVQTANQTIREAFVF